MPSISTTWNLKKTLIQCPKIFFGTDFTQRASFLVENHCLDLSSDKLGSGSANPHYKVKQTYIGHIVCSHDTSIDYSAIYCPIKDMCTILKSLV